MSRQSCDCTEKFNIQAEIVPLLNVIVSPGICKTESQWRKRDCEVQLIMNQNKGDIFPPLGIISYRISIFVDRPKILAHSIAAWHLHDLQCWPESHSSFIYERGKAYKTTCT